MRPWSGFMLEIMLVSASFIKNNKISESAADVNDNTPNVTNHIMHYDILSG